MLNNHENNIKLTDTYVSLQRFIGGEIAAGYDAETYTQYGINAAIVTRFAGLMIHNSALYGSVDAAVDGMQVSFIASPASGVQVFLLDGEPCDTYTWLETAVKYLEERFAKVFGVPCYQSKKCDYHDDLDY